jgi:hypothetical protein
MRPETFTFVLTNPLGGRRIGFCRRYLPDGPGARLPEVLCVVSRFPWFSLFSKLLATLEPLAPHQAVAFLRSLLASPFPSPGGRISLELPPPGAGSPRGSPRRANPGELGTPRNVHLIRPDDGDSPFSDVRPAPVPPSPHAPPAPPRPRTGQLQRAVRAAVVGEHPYHGRGPAQRAPDAAAEQQALPALNLLVRPPPHPPPPTPPHTCVSGHGWAHWPHRQPRGGGAALPAAVVARLHPNPSAPRRDHMRH